MLTITRWWDAAVVGWLTVVVVLAVITTRPLPWLTVGALASLAVAHLVIGRIAIRQEGTPLAHSYGVILVLAMAVACAGSPMAAMAQMVGYPLLWLLSPTVPTAVAWNVVMAVGVGLGSSRLESPLGASATALLSLAMSLLVGMWISRVAAYGAERDRLLTELRAAQREVAVLERAAGRDAERQRLALEIHDTIAQSLTGLVMTAQRAARELPSDDARTAENVAIITALATDALTEARALVAGWSAPVGALAGTLERLVGAFQRETGVQVELVDELAGTPLAREQEVVLLRCAQESLANVRKHAAASRVLVQLGVTAGAAQLVVIDDGVGLAATTSAPGEGAGIAGMRQRVTLAGGTVTVAAAPERGTRVLLRLPLEVSHDAIEDRGAGDIADATPTSQPRPSSVAEPA